MFDFFHGREDRLDLDKSKSTFSSLDNSSQIGANTCTNSSGTVTRFCSFGSLLVLFFICLYFHSYAVSGLYVCHFYLHTDICILLENLYERDKSLVLEVFWFPFEQALGACR